MILPGIAATGPAALGPAAGAAVVVADGSVSGMGSCRSPRESSVGSARPVPRPRPRDRSDLTGPSEDAIAPGDSAYPELSHATPPACGPPLPRLVRGLREG